MLKKFYKKKGQNVAEYAILIAIVIGAIIAMQTFMKRALQARIRGASEYMVRATPNFGNGVQYEPYYAESSYDVNKRTEETKRTNGLSGGSRQESADYQNRLEGGYQLTTYNGAGNIGAMMNIE